MGVFRPIFTPISGRCELFDVARSIGGEIVLIEWKFDAARNVSRQVSQQLGEMSVVGWGGRRETSRAFALYRLAVHVTHVFGQALRRFERILLRPSPVAGVEGHGERVRASFHRLE